MENIKDIPVVILCGGKGTRLKELTEVIPKPMVPVKNKPILWHIMKYYSSYGFNNFIICLGYKGNVIKDFFINYDLMQTDLRIDLGSKKVEMLKTDHDESEWNIVLAETGEDDMTASRIKQIEKYIDTDYFMLTYGDGLCDVDLDKLVNHHLSNDKIGTVTGIRPPARFGELVLEDDLVKVFSEKPQTTEGRINGGFFVFKKEMFNYLSEDRTVMLERAPLEKLASDGELMVYKHEGFWQCMDMLRDKEYLESLWESDNAPWKRW